VIISLCEFVSDCTVEAVVLTKGRNWFSEHKSWWF